MTDSGRAVKERVAICYHCKWRADRIEGGHKTRARYRIIRFRVRLITTSHDGADVVQTYYILYTLVRTAGVTLCAMTRILNSAK